MKTLNSAEISQVSGAGRADALAKANIIKNGLKNGDSWATIGQNIGLYFKNKYARPGAK